MQEEAQAPAGPQRAPHDGELARRAAPDQVGRWLAGAPPQRRPLVRHGLRTLLRAGDPAALALLGLEDAPALAMRELRVAPAPARIGEAMTARMRLVNGGSRAARAIVHLRVDFVTARGGLARRVFVVRELELGPGEEAPLAKRVSLRQQSTRTHHPGPHRVAAVVNGREAAAATVAVVAPR